MARQSNAAPVIKRKKIVGGGGHHGGAWKVAYADFVTAMMAFFMLMWLLNATTEKQRKGIADYFSPTIPLSRASGGGEGAFGGESVFSETMVAQNGTGASDLRPTEQRQAAGLTGVDQAADPVDQGDFEKDARTIQEALLGYGGESQVSDGLLRHITTRVTDEGLVVEFFDTGDEPLFDEGTATPRPVTTELAGVIARVFGLVDNLVAINGHIQAQPEVLRDNPAWDLSAARAMQMRLLVEAGGLEPARIQRVSGFADRRPVEANPAAPRNSRLELILLRSGS